jgi:ssDNA-binding Zn-finger/Zn-ribbon topoisomerase 1
MNESSGVDPIEARKIVEEKMAQREQEEISKLKPKKCPACGKDCIPRKGGYSGHFMGCPDFPACPGKAASLSSSQRRLSGQKLRRCYDFINRMGGVEEAKKWLDIAANIVTTFREDEQKYNKKVKQNKERKQ